MKPTLAAPVTASILRKKLSEIQKPDELEIFLQVGEMRVDTTKTQVIRGMKGLKDQSFIVSYTQKFQQRSSGIGGRCAVEDYITHTIVIQERPEDWTRLLPASSSIHPSEIEAEMLHGKRKENI